MNDDNLTGKSKILVTDDEQVIRDLFKKFLSKEGFLVSTAADGLDALEKIKENSFDMLILDLMIPKMTGMELIDKIRQFNKDMIIIIVTGYATVETAKEAIKKGCFDYITKPFDVEDVNMIIKRAFDIKRWAEEKKKIQEQLQVAEKLASLAQMGAGVAHETNTVLTSIKLFLEMWRSKLPKTQKEAKTMDLILEEIGRAEKLIARFLNFSKPEKAEFVKTDLIKLIKQNLQIFKYKLEKNKIDLLLEFKNNALELLCDPVQIGEVFLNLVSNSIDAMPCGGGLSISCELQDRKALIVVKDTGIGIAEVDLKRVFDPFFTTKQNGTGLGLSIVHRVIQEHNGLIKITSEKDKGTSVRVELPAEG